MTVFKVCLHSAYTTYIPSVIKKALYWFCWPFLMYHTTLCLSGYLSPDLGSLCAHVPVILDLGGGLHAPKQIEEAREGEKTKSVSLHPPTLGTEQEVTFEGMSSWSLRVHLKMLAQ